MNPLNVIAKYYETDSRAYGFLIQHSRLVARKAIEIASRVKGYKPDIAFVEEAAMLHDIGILFTNAPKIGCYGFKEYICHGYLGRNLLEKEGLPRHALVCERHVGVGVSMEDISNYRLPLPERDMLPESIEEKIVCFADKFYSKTEHELMREKPFDEVREIVKGYGEDKVRRFDEWAEMFL